MTRKNFGKGVDAFLESSMKKTADPSKDTKKKDRESRTTIHLRDTLLETVKAIARWERISIKDFIDKALNAKLAEINPQQLKQALDSYRSHLDKSP
jgi:hypothetical protein